jgi:hypothetical protein
MGAPAVAPPHVHGRDRHDHHREGLGGGAEGEQQEPTPVPFEVERRERGHGQHRREQVVARQDDRAEQQRREREQSHPAHQLPRGHALRGEHERGQAGRDHPAHGHHQLEHLHVAREPVPGDQPRKQKHRKRQRRILHREVAVRHEPADHDVPRVLRVLPGVPLPVESVPTVMDQVPSDHEADRGARHGQHAALAVRWQVAHSPRRDGDRGAGHLQGRVLRLWAAVFRHRSSSRFLSGPSEGSPAPPDADYPMIRFARSYG